MDKQEAIEYVQNKLQEYGSKIYEYQGERFIAIRNGFGKSDMAITFGEENMTMEFATQAARFAYGDEDDIAAHAEKYLKGELCAVEFYFQGQPLFGGSRSSEGMAFKTTYDVAFWYSGGNTEIADNIDKFLKERETVVVCSLWTGLPDRASVSHADGTMTEAAENK